MSWRYSTDSKRIYPFSSIQHLIAQSPFTVTLDIINVGITQIRRVKFQRTISAILKDVLGNNRSFSVFDNIYKDVCVKKNFHFLSTSKPNIHLVRSSAASFGVNLSQSTSSSISGSMFTLPFSWPDTHTRPCAWLPQLHGWASFIYSTTSCIKSTSAPFVQSRMGANAEAWILLIAAVIAHQCFGFRCKDKY